MGLFSRRRDTGPAVPEGMPESIEQGFQWQATAFIEAFIGEGSPIEEGALDYSPASLRAVDDMLDDFHRQSAPLPDDLHFLAASYVFEVVRREFGGRYLRGDDDDPFVLVIGDAGAQVGVMAFSRVMGRTLNGTEDDLVRFHDGIAPAIARATDVTLS